MSDRMRLLPNAAWREHKDLLARSAGHRRSWRESLACLVGRHDWMLDGGSLTEPRYADDPPRSFCARAHCAARKGPW